MDLSVTRCPSDTGADASTGVQVVRRLPDGEIEAHIDAATANGDAVSEAYFRTAYLGRSYFYHGFAYTNVAEFYGMLNAMGMAPGSAPPMPANTILGVLPVDLEITPKNWDANLSISAKLPWLAIPGTGYAGGNQVQRLREGIERFAITDINNPAAGAVAQSELVVLFDTFGTSADSNNTAGQMIFNHIPGGCNLLYLDGHAEFVRYPGKFPVIQDAENNGGIPRTVSHFGLG